jgi:hypothetical protein
VSKDEIGEIFAALHTHMDEREWGRDPGTMACIVKFREGETHVPASFMWAPDADEIVEVAHIWYDESLDQWNCMIEEGPGSIEMVTRVDGEEVPLP